MKFRFKIVFFCLISFAFISCDQVTKDLAKSHLRNSDPTSYFHDTFRLEYVENTGAAMSFGAGLPQPYNFWLLSIIPLLFLFVYALMKIKEFNFIRLLAFSLVFAGGTSNIIDRILHDRHVTDFMNIGIQNIRSGIFNVADICITAGVIGLFISYRNSNESTEQQNRENYTG